MGELLKIEELARRLADCKAKGLKVALANGHFDLLHVGHLRYLEAARRQGDVLVVAINDDDQVRAQKGEGRPIYDAEERLEILSELMCIDYLMVFDDPTVHGLIQDLRPDVLVKGGDYKPEELNEWELIQKLGLELRILANRPGLASTDVIERMVKTTEP